MKLYDYFRSSSSYRVRIALNLKKIRYEAIPIHLLQNGGEQKQPAYLQINPQGLVPTLYENGHTISQSLAIMEYLEEISPTPPLLPPSPLGKARVRSLALIIVCDMQPLNNLRVLNMLKSDFQASETHITLWYQHWLKQGFDAFEAQLETLSSKNNFCYGGELSLADICLIPQVYNAKRFNFAMDNYPLINEIVANCNNIPAFADASPD